MSDEPLLTWKGRRVRSPGDGPETAARKVPTAPIRPGSLFFVPSPLEGWGLDVLLDRLPAEGAVVVFEKDKELAAQVEGAYRAHLGRAGLDPRLFRLEEDTETAVQDLFRKLPLSRLRRCEFLTLGGSWMAHGPRYRQVFARLEEGLTRWWSNRMTSLHMGPLWVRNLFDNLTGDRFPGAPWPDWGSDTVLVCGAGVTLEEALPWARDHRASLRLVAADTALPVLKAWGLVPDAVVCLEAQHANLRDFSGWTGAPVQLFTDLTSYPPGTRVLGPSPCWFITEFTELGLWDRWPWPSIPRLPPLGSVGVAAAWVAWRLTRGPVVLAGLDFSYPQGQTHARGAPVLQGLAASTGRLAPMEQVGTWSRPGTRASPTRGWLTTPVMEGYAGVLADQARDQSSRTWVWSDQGLPLGLRRWDSQAPSAPLGRTTPASGGVVASVEPWLEGEKNLWERILETFVRLNQDPSDLVRKELEDQLRAVDYLTFSFPDPGYRPESDWLIRAQARVRWALTRVNRRRRS